MEKNANCMGKTRPIGIIGAMEVEAAHIKSEMTDVEVVDASGMEFFSGLLNGKPVVTVRCGVGKVNAAICTQVLIDRFDVRGVINTGVAGSLDAKIDIGDVVVSTDAVQHDVDVENFGYKPGQVPGFDSVAFAANDELRALAVDAVRTRAPEIGVFEGRVASGDQFVRDYAVKQDIVSKFGALCCEMEGAAIAQTCALNGVPFVILRAISDKADGSDSQDYLIFETKAAEHCARIVVYMVGR